MVHGAQDHMTGFGEFGERSADAVLQWGPPPAFLVHTQILASRSKTLETLISIGLPEGRPAAAVPALINLNCAGTPDFVIASTRRTQFLRHLYWGDEVELESLEDAAEICQLADFFGAPAIVRRVEGWLCARALHLLALANNKDSSDQLCAAFEVGTSRRLTKLTSLLLPWALLHLNRGPLAAPCWAVWSDAAARLRQLQGAMDSELKAVCLDAQWWSCGMPQCCAVCGCRSGDLALTTQLPSLCRAGGGGGGGGGSAAHCPASSPSGRPKIPDQYLATAVHLSHMLTEAQWGCTTPIPSGIVLNA